MFVSLKINDDTFEKKKLIKLKYLLTVLHLIIKTCTHLFLSLAKNVSGTQIFSAKSPDNVKISSSLLNAKRSSFQY